MLISYSFSSFTGTFKEIHEFSLQSIKSNIILANGLWSENIPTLNNRSILETLSSSSYCIWSRNAQLVSSKTHTSHMQQQVLHPVSLNRPCWLWCIRMCSPDARRQFVNLQDADISITWSKLRSLFPRLFISVHRAADVFLSMHTDPPQLLPPPPLFADSRAASVWSLSSTILILSRLSGEREI